MPKKQKKQVQSSDKVLAKEASLLVEQAEEQFMDNPPPIDIAEMLNVVKSKASEEDIPESWADQYESEQIASKTEDNEARDYKEIKELIGRAERITASDTTTSTDTKSKKAEAPRTVSDGKKLIKTAKSEADITPTQTKPIFGSFGTEKESRPHIDDDDEDAEDLKIHNSDNITESLASIQDMSEFRNNLDSFNEKLESLEEKIQLIMIERDILPDKLNVLKDDLNRQMTLMLDKLNQSLESNVSSTSVFAAAADINSARVISTEGLNAAAGYLRSDLDRSSPLVTTRGGLKKGKKFKPNY